MSSKDRYALGGHTFIYTPGGLQQGTRRSYDTSGMREHYRREFEHLVTPKRELALAENKAAIDLAQSALKTSVLINVGGFVAIQAAVPLFKLDAAAIQWPLLSTGSGSQPALPSRGSRTGSQFTHWRLVPTKQTQRQMRSPSR
jgi:hypothetical protein